MENVEVKDLGATISSDYASVGYRLHGVKPFCVIYSKFYDIQVKVAEFIEGFLVMIQLSNSDTQSKIS